ncbi:MAG: hypothetical protein ABJ308_07320 [Halieaceae bacterium]
MKIISYVVAFFLALSATTVLGGLAQPSNLVIDLDNNFAFGDQVTTRYSKNDTEFIGCGIRSFDNGDDGTFSFGFCQAGDVDENYVICYTTNTDLLDAIRGGSDFSYLQFGWNGESDPEFGEENNGTCTQIGFSTQSFYLPGGLKSNDKSKKSKKSKKDDD